MLGLHCSVRALLQLQHTGFSCGPRALEHVGLVAVLHRLSSGGTCASLVVAGGPGCPCSMWDLSSPSRNQTHIPCFRRQILNYWITGEVLSLLYFKSFSCITGYLWSPPSAHSSVSTSMAFKSYILFIAINRQTDRPIISNCALQDMPYFKPLKIMYLET